MSVFVMPSLGADMEAGKLVEWIVKPGDRVHRGDVVAVVETQKGAIEIEIFEEGTVTELLAEIGRELPVGAPLATVLSDSATAHAPKTPPEKVPYSKPAVAAPNCAPLEGVAAPETPATPKPPELPARPKIPEVTPPSAFPGRHRASPAARRLAEKLGIDVAELKGSGPGGAILWADVESAAPGQTATKASPMEEMRKAIAAAMTRAKRTIPHYYLSQTIDLDPAIAFLEDRNAALPPGERVLLGALFVRATTLAANRVRVLNGHYFEDRGFVPSETVNPGVAVALRGGGLVAPALFDAGSMTLEAIMTGMRDLVSRARAGRLRGSELTQGTITVSSLGDTGAEGMTGVIFPPQVALVGIGAPQLRPWVVEGAVVPRHVVTITLSADHRVSDGRQGARFIAEFEDLMKHPETL